jgi:hypothetical protein
MISRLMLSLKKASQATETGWTSHALSGMHARTISRMEFERPPNGLEGGGGTTSEDIALSDVSDEEVGGSSGEGTV